MQATAFQAPQAPLPGVNIGQAAVNAGMGVAQPGQPAAHILMPNTAPIEHPAGERFEFDAEFQRKVAAFAIRDIPFVQQAEGLLKPQFFENAAQAWLVSLASEFYQRYHQLPDTQSFALLVKQAVESKRLRAEMVAPVVEEFRHLYQQDLSNREFVLENVAVFARTQAYKEAIMKAADLIDKNKLDGIEKLINEAQQVGLRDDEGEYDYFEEIESRTNQREAQLAGILPPSGITSGIRDFDELLLHKGWGRKELSVIMGGAKAGKSTALLNFARGAAMAGFNVYYGTLEVGAKIMSDRLDAGLTATEMKALAQQYVNIDEKVRKAKQFAGKLIMAEHPAGTMTVSMLRRALKRHASRGLLFDLVVIDYADLMAPEFRTDDEESNAKQVWTNLRGVATSENVAILTATQTNRDGFKASVAKAEHVANSFEKIRIADLVISINKTEEEMARNEARLFFAASRNQEGHFTVRIQQDIARMIFIKGILGIE